MGEDGIGGISDEKQYLCFALALWNGADPILKERFFGLSGTEGNHGEDVKEYYFYLDNTPTHSYMKMLYKYPQREFPYGQLISESRRRGYADFEYELLDTGIFEDNRYFDVILEYAKADFDDLFIRISVTNHAQDTASITLLPTLWFRNTWAWGYPAGPMDDVPTKPQIRLEHGVIIADHPSLGIYYLYADAACECLFTENETNTERLYGLPNAAPYVKDAFHRYVIQGETKAINPAQVGTKAATVHRLNVEGGATQRITLRLSAKAHTMPFADSERLIQTRIAEADHFLPALLTQR